jgi:hypothetical protein
MLQYHTGCDDMSITATHRDARNGCSVREARYCSVETQHVDLERGQLLLAIYVGRHVGRPVTCLE